jgi:hypothetical protein
VTCEISAGLFPCIIRDGQTGEKRLKMTVREIMRSFQEAFPEFISKFTEANINLSVGFCHTTHTHRFGLVNTRHGLRCEATPVADSLLLSV